MTTKDYPRMRRFWRWLFAIIGAVWTAYGLFVMTLGLITDPVMRYACLMAVVVCSLFFGLLAWGPTHRFAVRHPYLLYGTGLLMFGLGVYTTFTLPPESQLLFAGIGLMVGGTLVFTLPWLLRDERRRS